jgi:hypothetical protein
VPFFFDLSSLVPVAERNPFEPVVVPDLVTPASPLDASADEAPAALPAPELQEEMPAEPIVDTGLPIPAHYDFDMMRVLVQDPFRLFCYWQLKDNPFDRLRRIFSNGPNGHNGDNNGFHTVLKLIDETNNIAVFFHAAYTREYWFSVFPDRSYRVELGVRSSRYGYIKLLSSQTAHTPRGGPSDRAAPEEDYRIEADEYLEVLRASHLVPERAFTLDGLLPGANGAPAAARNAVWESLPPSFRRLMRAISDIQAGRDYDRWWERLSQENLAELVREFLNTVAGMGDGELGYMLLLRYLPELLRRAVRAETQVEGQPQEKSLELQIDKPITLYLAEHLGQVASEMNVSSSSDHAPSQPLPGQGAPGESVRWLPSLSS